MQNYRKPAPPERVMPWPSFWSPTPITREELILESGRTQPISPLQHRNRNAKRCKVLRGILVCGGLVCASVVLTFLCLIATNKLNVVIPKDEARVVPLATATASSVARWNVTVRAVEWKGDEGKGSPLVSQVTMAPCLMEGISDRSVLDKKGPCYVIS